MKKIIAIALLVVMCFSAVSCNSGGAPSTDETTNKVETPVVETEPAETEAPKPNYAEVVPPALQGVWGDTSMDGIITLYAFKDTNVETFVVNVGEGAASVLAGTFSVEDTKVSYKFGTSSGYSNFTYENDVLTLSNANNAEMKKLTSADLMAYLVQEESSANNNGVIILADVIAKYFPDSAESGTAVEKKNNVKAAIKAAADAALARINTTYDKVQQLTWYQHKNQPQYVDITSYIYPYIGRMDSGKTWLRVAINYTDAKTDAGWLFFDNIIFSVDGQNTTKFFNRSDIVRDNDTEVWETADVEADASYINLLRSIANSTETIIRFQGDEYYDDHIVTAQEKQAILDILAAYDYLSNNAE